ncbi:hypothetical protein FL857_05885 [Criibacterium bergeronii]|uniref:Uncharacterized protein n=1 Tax=Criibacterium bergeronii TaxID=1871336 RepID=A0A552V6Y6_9FIRM|nr:hypothetical protein [Criibacterium bergeronii]TRW26215.1 hypothetical protein FL857_05885 [Criibacterium bergeronii]
MNLKNMLKRLTFNYTKVEGSNVYKLFSIVALSVEELKELFEKISSWQGISNAEGTTLDLIGEDVRQKRNGMTDDEYRLQLRFKNSLNRSGTDINSVNNIIKSFSKDEFIKIKDATDDEYFKEPAAIVIYMSNNSKNILNNKFEAAVAAGVRTIWLIYRDDLKSTLKLEDKKTDYQSRMYVTGEIQSGVAYKHQYVGKVITDNVNLGENNATTQQRTWVTGEPKSGQGGK